MLNFNDRVLNFWVRPKRRPILHPDLSVIQEEEVCRSLEEEQDLSDVTRKTRLKKKIDNCLPISELRAHSGVLNHLEF